MKTFVAFFCLSLLAGQLGAISVKPGVTVYLHDIVLCLFLVIRGISLMRNKKIKRPTLLIPIAGFIFAGLLSLLMNMGRFPLVHIGEGSLYLLRFTLYTTVYVLLIQTSFTQEFLFFWLYITGTAVSILGFIQYIWYPALRNLVYLGWDEHYLRLFATFFDPNFTGIFIVLTLLLGFHLTRTYRKAILFITLGINLFALYLTFSRSSYLAFIFAFLLYAIVAGKRKLVLALVVFLIAVICIPKPGGHTLLLTRVPSAIARIGNWRESVQILSRAPVFGHGFNTLRYVHNETHPDRTTEPISRSAAGLDSSLLFVLATTGTVGLVSYLWFAISWIRMSWKKPSVQLLSSSVLVALFIHSLFTNSLFYPWVMVWFWIYTSAVELTSGN